MSLSDSNVLPALYDALATPPLSPVMDKRHFRTSTTPLYSPLATPDRSPDLPLIDLTSPLVSRRPSINAPKRPIASLAPPPPADPAVFEPLNSAPRSLHPAQFSPHPKPLRLAQYPAQLHVDTAADSLTREKKGKMPALSHLLNVGGGRVLALAADERYVYAGCQSADNEIIVFSRNSLQPMFRLLGHQGSVMALMVIEAKGWLVSSSSAGDIRIWCSRNLEPLHIIHPCDDTAGDIYSLAWDERNGGTLYFGTQGATIEWINFGPKSKPNPLKETTTAANASITVPVLVNGASPGEDIKESTPAQRSGRYKPHHFFDKPASTTGSGTTTPRTACSPRLTQADLDPMSRSDPGTPSQIEVDELEVAVEDRWSFAHYGYVYALQMVDRPEGGKWLVSGSGDSDVKVWSCAPGGGLQLIREFTELSGGVLSLAYRDSLLYAGLQDGEILIWDLETSACIRTIEAHEADVLSMSVLGGEVYTAAADGRVLRLDEEFDCTAAFRAHQGIVLGSVIVKGIRDGWDLITAGNDSYVKIWSIQSPQGTALDRDVKMDGEGDVMLYALSKLISVPTVSDDAHRESCRQGAHLLKKILQQLGATAEVLSGEQGKNPLVLATFSATSTSPSPSPAPNGDSATPAEVKARRRLLFYGHYDVQPAAEEEWETNPWELSGRNGYLYGRGVSDNKGPILAVACAAAALRRSRELEVDVVLLIEGEEEAGSRGFASTVRKNKDAIGHIDTILLSNSTWINEDSPCVVYGMRGVVYANLTISSGGADAHSGVDGGMVAEPMFDMVRVLGGIGDSKSVKLPGFYDNVRPQSDAEMSLLAEVAKACHRPVEELNKVWRQPSFSIANITTSSASSNKTVIPKRVTADISMRLVPDQNLQAIVAGLKRHCGEVFNELQSANTFEMNITHHASWWLASLDNPYLQALEASVEEIWGKPPLKIREGGTVPTIFWLESEFGAPCVHLPLGQASDAGHLANERMRLLNLRNGKRVVESYLGRVAKV